MTPSPFTDNPEAEQKPERDPLLDALKGPVLKLIESDVRNAIDPEKITQYAEIRRNELYWRGCQYLTEVYSSDGGQIRDYKPINGTWHEFQNDDDSDGAYSTVVNDIRGYGRKFIAVLAQQPPNVKFEPNDDQNDEHIKRAKMAQRVGDLLHNLWDVKGQNRKLFLTFYKNGTAFGHTTFVADEEKYGFTEEPETKQMPTPLGPSMLNCVQCGTQTPVPNVAEAPPTCPNCGRPFGPEDLREPETAMLPQETGQMKRYANGCVEHRCESGLRVTTLFDIEELIDTPFLLMEQEVHKGKIFQKFPWLRDKFQSDSGDSYGGGESSTTSGQITRDLASSPSGTYIAPRKNRLLFSECWLRPTMYELARGNVTIPGVEGQPSQTMDLRKALAQFYPTGLKATLVNGDTLVKLEESRMDDEWCIAPPEPAENAFPDPICKDFLDVQDQTNDFANIQRQTWERAIPQVILDTSRLDTRYQAKYRQLPASFIPIRGGAGGNINDAIGHLPVAKPEPEMEQYGVEQREHGAEIIGITPQIYGGGAAEQTAYATNLKRNQAMLQLSTYADAAREYWCEVTYNAVMLMAKHSNGVIPSPFAPRQETVKIEDIQELLQGGFHCEAGDAMPMSWPEQREQLNENLKNLSGNPEVLHMLGFMEPKNIPKLQDTLLGMPEWTIPNQNALGKVHRSIQELLKSQPTEQPSMAVPGQMVQIPSVPVDEWDPHDFVAQTLADWMDSEKGNDARMANPAGFANVAAFWKSHKGLSLPPPMPGPAGPGGPGPGGPQGPPPPQGPGHLQPPPGGQQAAGAPPQ